MWTPKGPAKSVHISEPSTVVDTLCCGHIIISQAMPKHDYIGKINGPGKKCPLKRSVRIGGVSTRGNSTVLSSVSPLKTKLPIYSIDWLLPPQQEASN